MDMTEDQRLVEWDWLDTAAGGCLHHADLAPERASELVDESRIESVRLTCGHPAGVVFLPGVFSRMGAARRCKRCCTALGYPQGVGSPKNDEACRPLVQARIA